MLVPALAGPLIGEDWLMYLRDPAHSSSNAVENQLTRNNIAALRVKWEVSLGATIAAAPTIVNGTMYVGAWDGNFYALDASNGDIKWKRNLGKAPDPENPICMAGIGVTSQAAVVDGTVYAGGGDSAIYALDAATGDVVWRVSLADPASGSYIWSSITHSKDALYVGIASLSDCPLVRGALARIELPNPTHPLIRYLAPATEVGAGIWSTPAVDEAHNTVYVTTGTGEQDFEAGLWGGSFLALDATTLEIKAHFLLPTNTVEGDIEWGSSPTLFKSADGSELVGANGKDGVLYVLRRGDLTPEWTNKLAVECISPEQGCGSISTPAFDGKILYSGAGDNDIEGFPKGSVYALDPATGVPLWQQQTDGAVIAPVTVANGLLYVSTQEGLLIFNAATGDQLWQEPENTLLYSQPVVLDGTVFTTSVKGRVTAWRVPEPIALPQTSARESTSFPGCLKDSSLRTAGPPAGSKPLCPAVRLTAGPWCSMATCQSASGWTSRPAHVFPSPTAIPYCRARPPYRLAPGPTAGSWPGTLGRGGRGR